MHTTDAVHDIESADRREVISGTRQLDELAVESELEHDNSGPVSPVCSTKRSHRAPSVSSRSRRCVTALKHQVKMTS